MAKTIKKGLRKRSCYVKKLAFPAFRLDGDLKKWLRKRRKQLNLYNNNNNRFPGGAVSGYGFQFVGLHL
jgi:hypothetical protein